MHLNYHFLKFLCPAIENKLIGFEISTCFSQNKDELIIGCTLGDQESYIRANFLPSISCLSFPDEFKRGKKNTVSLFPELIGQTILSFELIQFERAFKVHLSSGDTLLFKLHGTRSNMLYFPSGQNTPSKLSRNELKDDYQITLDSLSKDLELSYDNFILHEGNASRFIPTLGKVPREWLKSHGYIEASISEKWSLMQTLLDMLESPLFSIVRNHDGHYLTLLPSEQPVFTSADPIASCNELFKYLVVVQAFEKEKNHWIKYFEDISKKSRAYIHKTEEKLNLLENETSPSQIADVIMANLHQIPKGIESVELFNFYTQRDQTIKLKRGVSPQKSAENLYRKSKNRKIELDQLYQNLSDKEALLEDVQYKLNELREILNFKELRAFLKDHNLINQQKEKQEQTPFKRFEIEGFEVLVGKSAKANDEMLRYFAWKEDLWLHAKDVSGSHVIIKYKSGLNIPKPVLERAAELAAYYSKSKNDSLASVMYTPVKFVRKVKGSAPGAVMVDREQVIMVTPSGPRD
ncbi:NFACT RNA binding domain-containing protein [Belliella sp. DSM 111904]|uniref:NFACT RNA binding domain-containing protein n=1 Tax=Belliella filtrata TaxID=2923435 RepID=A0ABS9UWW4_9BACT|nr:NFACT RNA binding domain-containing protein [Belliella filtrata]MCH7408632.1 NFACT RNA binding domain-containing protein [Belliella filtrata]